MGRSDPGGAGSPEGSGALSRDVDLKPPGRGFGEVVCMHFVRQVASPHSQIRVFEHEWSQDKPRTMPQRVALHLHPLPVGGVANDGEELGQHRGERRQLCKAKNRGRHLELVDTQLTMDVWGAKQSDRRLRRWW